MISRQDLERLAKVKSDHGILSAYVRLDPRLRFVRRQAVAQFKGAFKAAQRRIQEGRWQDALEREGSHVLNFLSNWEPAGEGLVIFSCRPDSLWEVLPLEFPVPNHVDIDTTTKTGILAQSLDEVPGFVIAVLQGTKRGFTSRRRAIPNSNHNSQVKFPVSTNKVGALKCDFSGTSNSTLQNS